jgi:hypothetical protein
MYLEVPNIEAIGRADVVEEFFIDKHNFHFDRHSLCSRLETMGFNVEWGKEDCDAFNIGFLVSRNRSREESQPENALIAMHNRRLIAEYETRLNRNRQRLSRLAEQLYGFMARQRVVFWGAGRIFDALIRYGGLRTDRMQGLVDSYLFKIMPRVHGVAVSSPDILRTQPPDVVVILARSSVQEIKDSVRRFGIRHVICFEDLILNTVSGDSP